MKKTITLFVAIVAIAALNSCKPSDEKITNEIKTVITAEAKLAPVSYSVKEGVLTLTGEVETDAEKALAEEKLKAVKGVKSVINNITVKPKVVLPTPAELKAQADAALSTLVTTALSATGISGINASVVDSVVTLTGDVKKADLVKVMQAVMGTTPKKVDNKMNIIKK
jgi:hyperosmotically inducible periplasmic protein